MSNHRDERLAAAYQRELSDIICYHVRDPRLMGVYVTNVVFTGDLKLAKVYYSVPGGRVREKEVEEGFYKSKSFIKREISHRVKVKYSPDVVFYYDDREEMRETMDSLFEKISKQHHETGEEH